VPFLSCLFKEWCRCVRVSLSVLHRWPQDAFLEAHGVKLGFMGAFVKAAADALQRVPAVNGVIDGTDIIYRDYCDISIAVATPKGLVVPVLRNADQLDFAGIERVTARLPPELYPIPYRHSQHFEGVHLHSSSSLA